MGRFVGERGFELCPGSSGKQGSAERSLRSFDVKESDVWRPAVRRNADIADFIGALLRCASVPPPRHAKRVSGTPSLRRKEGIVSLLPPALALHLAKLASGPCRATTQPSRWCAERCGQLNIRKRPVCPRFCKHGRLMGQYGLGRN